MNKNVLITAGPAWEPIDAVRRITNHSTGTLGSFLAEHLQHSGNQVTLLYGESATAPPPASLTQLKRFSHSQSLQALLEDAAARSYDLILHLAAVADYRVHSVNGLPPGSGKLSTRSGNLQLTLQPAPKLIALLRPLFPTASLVGWKYEVEGDRAETLDAGLRQVCDNHTHACVVNGPAYGDGFGWVTPDHPPLHADNRDALLDQIMTLLQPGPAGA